MLVPILFVPTSVAAFATGKSSEKANTLVPGTEDRTGAAPSFCRSPEGRVLVILRAEHMFGKRVAPTRDLEASSDGLS